MSALEDKVIAVVAAGPAHGVRFVDVWLALEEPPYRVFEALRALSVHTGPLRASGMGNVDRPMTPRYSLSPRRSSWT